MPEEQPDFFKNKITNSKRLEFYDKFRQLLIWGILEGVIDPLEGNGFSISQLEIDPPDIVLPEGQKRVVTKKALLGSIVIPDPIETRLSQMKGDLDFLEGLEGEIAKNDKPKP